MTCGNWRGMAAFGARRCLGVPALEAAPTGDMGDEV